MAKKSRKLIANNKKARHDYFVEDSLEAGIVLTGTEIKSIRAGEITVCRNGVGVDIDEEYASEILGEDEIEICITIDNGNASATCWGCDITYDYIKLNGNYRK